MNVRDRLQGGNSNLRNRLQRLGGYNQTHRHGEAIGKFNASHTAGELTGFDVPAQRSGSIQPHPDQQAHPPRNPVQGDLPGWLMAALIHRHDISGPPTKPPNPGVNPLAPSVPPKGSEGVNGPRAYQGGPDNGRPIPRRRRSQVGVMGA